ncbi:MAG: KH domain-containing protein [Candidatus Aenigmarchaeota archaeon]|nr:KH domain-containing protein [Candidatus Aenigmarchaeota archaeon]
MKDFIKIPEERKKILKKNKKIKEKIEKFTNTKIEFNDDVSIEGESFDVYQTKQVLKAFGRGFDVDDCLYLLEDEYGLEIISLSEFTKSKERMTTLKGRIIGTGGKTKRYLEKYTDVKLCIFGKTVGIIGKWDKINIAKEAIMKIIQGCTHQTLYRWLERKSIGD